MQMFRRLFIAAASAGLLSGLFAVLVHEVTTWPIILEAEVFEKAADEKAAAAAMTMTPAPADAAPAEPQAESQSESHEGHDHAHDGAEWEPQDGWERIGTNGLADLLTGIGFALLLVSAYAFSGAAVDWRRGLYWGLAAFATFTLAPGLGLPPEVPGTSAAPLLDRQIWWIATAVATGGGLAAIFLGRKAVWVVGGIVLIVLPHLIGAPQPAEHTAAAPESLAHQFIVAAVVTSLLFWLVLGSLTGFLYKRIAAA